MPPPRIVTIGAGTGHAAILRGLRELPVDLTAIVGVTDNGGHTGVLRKALGGPALGDARHCLEALCEDERWCSILKTRGTRGPMRGTSVGNLMLAALVRQHGSLSKAIDVLRRGLGIRARLLPVSDGAADVVAELARGRRVRGEWQILQRHLRTPIRGVMQEPPLRLLPAAGRAIARADLIVLAPGALWTALGAVLCTRDMPGALRKARAPKVWVANILSQPPQLDSGSIEDHVAALASILGAPPDFVLANTRRPPAGLLRRYAATGARWLAPPGNGRAAGGRVPASSVQNERDLQSMSQADPGHRAGHDRPVPAPTAASRRGASSGTTPRQPPFNPQSKIRNPKSADRPVPAPTGRVSPPLFTPGDFLERPSQARLRAYDRHAAPNMAAAPHWIRHDGRRVARALLELVRSR